MQESGRDTIRACTQTKVEERQRCREPTPNRHVRHGCLPDMPLHNVG